MITFLYRRKNNFCPYSRKFGNLVNKKFESYLRATINQDIDAKYSSNYSSTILLLEAFDYSNRELESSNLVDFLAKRRACAQAVHDKTKNTLNAIPGSPGIGKSAFLAHFPESSAYLSYLKAHNCRNSPLVIPVTFNSPMNGENNAFALRMMYGAYFVMSGTNVVNFPSWSTFFKEFQEFEFISAKSGLETIREIYGRDRPVILLVDEISKAFPVGSDKIVMREIGTLLDDHSSGFIDVIVSSLSPNYLSTLVIGTSRPITYTFLPPLLNSSLGKVEAEIFTSNVLKYMNTQNVNKIFVRTLEASYLLVSGYPRRLQFLVRHGYLKKKEIETMAKHIEKKQRKNAGGIIHENEMITDFGVCAFFFHVVKFVDRVAGPLQMTAPPEINHHILELALNMRVDIGQLPSSAADKLENGSVFIYPVPNQPDEFRLAMLLSNFICTVEQLGLQREQAEYRMSISSDIPPMQGVGGEQAVLQLSSRYSTSAREEIEILVDERKERLGPRAAAAVRLFGSLVGEDRSISSWWERSIALSIVCRSLSRMSVEETVGFDLAGTRCPPLAVRSAYSGRDMWHLDSSGRLVTNELVMPSVNQKGYDFMVSFERRDSHSGVTAVYGQVKLRVDPGKPLVEVIAKALVYTIVSHLTSEAAEYIPLSDVYLALYIWKECDEVLPSSCPLSWESSMEDHASVETLLTSADVKEYVTTLLSLTIPIPREENEIVCSAKKYRNEILEYIDACYQEQVVLVQGKALEHWLVPTLIPLPMIASHMLSVSP